MTHMQYTWGVLSEALKALEKLVPIPGCALGHYGKTKVSPLRVNCSILHMHTPCTHPYIRHTTVSTHSRAHRCEALIYRAPTVAAHDQFAHSGKD